MGTFVAERNSQLRSMEETLKSQCFFQIRDKCGEEREINRKIQDEQMRLLEVERDTRLRQSTELRGELMKAVSKEREERMLERFEQRTEITKVMREWHLAKGSAGSGPLPSLSNTPNFKPVTESFRTDTFRPVPETKTVGDSLRPLSDGVRNYTDNFWPLNENFKPAPIGGTPTGGGYLTTLFNSSSK